MTSYEVIADYVGAAKAYEVVADLNRAGYIIVDKGAIGRAQREAVAAHCEDLMSVRKAA